MHVLLGPLILFAAVMSLTPGPNVIMVTASAANFGFRRTVPQMIGITLGFAVLVVMAGLGLAAAVQADPRIQTAIKYAGGAYLLYLAWCILRAEDGPARGAANPIGFARALFLQFLNPKGWVFAFGAIAAYASTDGDRVAETAVIAGINATTCLMSVLIWGAFGTTIGRFLDRPRARRAFNALMAILLVLSLVPVFA
jgi:threonine/homoserine/homoserine lactone efflux protein